MADRLAYNGDTALQHLLRESGSSYDPDAVRSLLGGVLAAPSGEDPDGWMALVAPRVTPALADQLRALRRTVGGSGGPESAAVGAVQAERLAALRAELKRRGLAGFVVPRSDEHMGEYVP